MHRVRSAARVGVGGDLEVSDAARGRVDRPCRPPSRPRLHYITAVLFDNSSCPRVFYRQYFFQEDLVNYKTRSILAIKLSFECSKEFTFNHFRKFTNGFS